MQTPKKRNPAAGVRRKLDDGYGYYEKSPRRRGSPLGTKHGFNWNPLKPNYTFEDFVMGRDLYFIDNDDAFYLEDMRSIFPPLRDDDDWDDDFGDDDYW